MVVCFGAVVTGYKSHFCCPEKKIISGSSAAFNEERVNCIEEVDACVRFLTKQMTATPSWNAPSVRTFFSVEMVII